jgi:hypothetical protein
MTVEAARESVVRCSACTLNGRARNTAECSSAFLFWQCPVLPRRTKKAFAELDARLAEASGIKDAATVNFTEDNQSDPESALKVCSLVFGRRAFWT